MSNKSDCLEVVQEGWLTKSPPTKRIWRARWRRRWFVLRHSGELPGQYFLYYYTDRNCRKLKGQIDLDQCEQVDAGLRFENRKQKYQYMFVVKTPKRTYYLAAETELEMNKWVDCICHVCGLRAFSNEENNFYGYGGIEDEPSIAEESSQNAESPPVSPTSTASGPYIPLNECFTGKLPLPSADGTINRTNAQSQPAAVTSSINGDEFYDAPRKLQPPNLELRVSESSTPPLQSPATDAESVFTDEEWTNPHPKPPVNWKTFPKPSDSSLEGDVPRASVATMSVAKRFTRVLNEDEVVLPGPVAPPRPPKPSHLSPPDPSEHHYLNLENCGGVDGVEDVDGVNKQPAVGGGITDDMYDFPRTHNIENTDAQKIGVVAPIPQTRHCYTNAAPSNKSNGMVFRYDFATTDEGSMPDHPSEPISPVASETSSTAHYSNLPSPSTPSLPTPPPCAGGFVAPPPFVNRGLKPRRKTSDSAASNEPSPGGPPNVDRALKPTPVARNKFDHHLDDSGCPGPFKLCPPPTRRGFSTANSSTVAIGDYGSLNLKRTRAGPSPSPPIPQPRRHSDTSEPDLRKSDHEIYRHRDHWLSSNPYLGSKRWDEIEYLDLDLNSADYSGANRRTAPVVTSSAVTPTVYKTVDFLKTEAFNRTRRTVEAERKHL